MNPTVSVVIASYNYAHFVRQAIDSVLAQTFQDFEIVLADDGSTDNTREAVAGYAADPRIKLHHIEHVGHPRAKNYGVGQAVGKYVAFLDADDMWAPTKLERQLELFAKDPELAVVYGRCQRIDQQGRRLETPPGKLFRGHIVEPLVVDNFVCFSSAMVRRDLLAGDQTFDNTLNDPIDYDLWLRLALVSRFDYVDEPLVLYRVGHASMSRTNNRWAEQVDRVMRRFAGEYGGGQVVDRRLLRESEYGRACLLGLLARDRSRGESLRHYLHALRIQPLAGAAWYGLAALCVPEAGRRVFRRLRGQAADWREPRLAPEPNAGQHVKATFT